MDFYTFARNEWGPGWAICRNTAVNRERYARCITQAEYKRVLALWRQQHTVEALRDNDGELTASLYAALELLTTLYRCGYHRDTDAAAAAINAANIILEQARRGKP